MQKTSKNKEKEKVLTRAEKRDATKNLIKEILKKSDLKASELIDEAAKVYSEKFASEETENPNDVKGRIGSVLDVMKKEGEVAFDKGRYALNAEKEPEMKEEKKKKTTRKTAKKTDAEIEKAEKTADKEEKKTSKKAAVKKAKKEEAAPLPTPPIMPIAPVVPVTPESAPEPIPEEKPAPKKRGRKPKQKIAESLENTGENAISKPDLEEKKEDVQEKMATTLENKGEEPVSTEKSKTKTEIQEKIAESLENKGENVSSTKTSEKSIMDVSFLLGNVKPSKKEEKPKTENPVIKKETKPETLKRETKAEELKAKSVEKKPLQKAPAKKPQPAPKKAVAKTLTADEKLQAAFLNRLHRLGGDYFEYYSVYLLEKYSRMNGRRLEALKITGGERDGGIDGEIELTDKLGFRETIYIQAKNWDPDKGDEKLWVVGETLLQQFIGACVCRQAKDGKQHCRGIFITTSRFTSEAKKILEDTSDKFVGYDGSDLYEAAKECSFGIVKKNGEWVLDEELLSGVNAFFNMM